MEFGVGDPCVLKPQCIPTSSPSYTWRNKQELRPVWQRLDRFYVPTQWIPRVKRVEVHVGSFQFDHFPVTMEMRLSVDEPGGHRRNALCFFRVNMDVARSAPGSAGVKDILLNWQSREEPKSPLKRLELALEECAQKQTY